MIGELVGYPKENEKSWYKMVLIKLDGNYHPAQKIQVDQRSPCKTRPDTLNLPEEKVENILE